MVLDVGGDLTGEDHEVMDDEANDMEAVGNDAGVGEPASDQGPVRAGEVDADHSDPLAPLQGGHKGVELLWTASGQHVKDLVVFEVGKGGGKAGSFVEGVLVDTQDRWALETQAFAGLAGGELMVNALDGGRPEMEGTGESRGANAVMMATIDVLPERLGAMASWPDPGQRRDKRVAAVQAAKPPGVNEKPGRFAKAAQMLSLA